MGSSWPFYGAAGLPVICCWRQKMKAGSNVSAPSKEGDKDSAVISYSADKVIGNGSFGVVFKATKVDTGEVVAIKKVLQDKRFKNRELQIMRMLTHPCVVPLKHCFYSSGEEPDETYLNLVLEFIPETIYMICRRHSKAKQFMPIDRVKMYSFQLLRSLAYIHVWECVTVTLSHRICWSIQRLSSSSSVTLEVPSSWSKENQMYRTFAPDTTEHQSASLGRLAMTLRSTRGALAV